MRLHCRECRECFHTLRAKVTERVHYTYSVQQQMVLLVFCYQSNIQLAALATSSTEGLLLLLVLLLLLLLLWQTPQPAEPPTPKKSRNKTVLYSIKLHDIALHYITRFKVSEEFDIIRGPDAECSRCKQLARYTTLKYHKEELNCKAQ